MTHTYILYSQALDRYYIGHTGEGLDERIRKHLSGHDGYTSRAKDWQLVWFRSYETKEDAYAMEREIKSWKSPRRIRQFVESRT